MRFRTLRPSFAGVTTLAVLVALTVAGLNLSAEMATGESVHVAARSSAPHALRAGHALVAGTRDSSLTNGWYTLLVTPAGVTIYETIPVPFRNRPVSTTWTTGTWMRQDPTGRFQPNRGHTQLRLRRNGDLALVTAHGHRLWHSGTGGSGGVVLRMRRGGNLTLENRSGKIVWASHSGQVQMSGGMTLGPGERLRDAWETAFAGGKPVTLEMQRNGNLVHRCGSAIDWQTGTHVRGSTLRMYRNGALRIVGPKGRVVWSSHSGGNYHYAALNGSQMWINTDRQLAWEAPLDFWACSD